MYQQKHINPNSLDKGSWRILKDCYCSVTMLRELGLNNNLYKATIIIWQIIWLIIVFLMKTFVQFVQGTCFWIEWILF